ncbi:MAG: DEAD/DEAH box helicase [Chloroflexi bacterium]|nr:DEAD/DEAH box helicase [Chloroflexota bacterium]
MLHPIKALDHVIDSYRDYLITEFRARDERLKDELQEALTRENFLAREPFFSAHTAFESGKAWEALGLDERLAASLRKRAGGNDSYLHQSLAIEHLLGGSGKPIVISTGTGSGKTEAFLAPVLHSAIEDAITNKTEPGWSPSCFIR